MLGEHFNLERKDNGNCMHGNFDCIKYKSEIDMKQVKIST